MKNKKTKKLWLAFLIVFILSFTILNSVIYSSQDDPLITLSYLTEILVPQMTETIKNSLSDSSIKIPETNSSVSSEYQIAELTYGSKLLPKGSIEFILRPGSTALVVAPLETQGISDLTEGQELYNGDNVPINHYCIVPRGDGRGIIITSEKAYIMVRGEFEIG